MCAKYAVLEIARETGFISEGWEYHHGMVSERVRALNKKDRQEGENEAFGGLLWVTRGSTLQAPGSGLSVVPESLTAQDSVPSPDPHSW